MNEQICLFSDNPEYEAFEDKFKRKLTTDDCYTPPEVFAVIQDWACREYGIDPDRIVRPFMPGGDYEAYPYQPGDVVLDNPPFSILSQIQEFYVRRNIPFFLFAPSLTCLSWSAGATRLNHLVCDAKIVYENGAVVTTSFITTFGGDVVMQTAPDLTRAINRVVDKLQKEKTRTLPKYIYPDNVATAAMLQRYSRYGVDFKVRRSDCTFIRALDSQRPEKKTIFGGGLLLSERAAAERAAAERAAAERAAAERAAAERAAAERAAAERWQLSVREKAIIAELGTKEK